MNLWESLNEYEKAGMSVPWQLVVQLIDENKELKKKLERLDRVVELYVSNLVDDLVQKIDGVRIIDYIKYTEPLLIDKLRKCLEVEK